MLKISTLVKEVIQIKKNETKTTTGGIRAAIRNIKKYNPKYILAIGHTIQNPSEKCINERSKSRRPNTSKNQSKKQDIID